MKTPHKHAAIIKAWADGEQIQAKLPEKLDWTDTTWPGWNTDIQYRIKPEPKPDVVYTRYVKKGSNPSADYLCFITTEASVPNVKFIFDGEAGELKSVELIK